MAEVPEECKKWLQRGVLKKESRRKDVEYNKIGLNADPLRVRLCVAFSYMYARSTRGLSA